MPADWVYYGELSKSITTPSSNDQESKKKLNLTLDMLGLAHRWEVTELSSLSMRQILSTPTGLKIVSHTIQAVRLRFAVREHAEMMEAEKLLRACKDFEEKNQDIIREAQG